MGSWLPVLLTSAVHRSVVDHWSLLSAQQTPTSCSSRAGSHPGPLAPRAGSVPDPAPPWGHLLGSWEVPLRRQPLLPLPHILAGGSREKETPQSGRGFAAAVVSPQGGGLHGATRTSPLASHGLDTQMSPSATVSWHRPEIHRKSRY